jgi:hypothetical protein
MARLPQLSAGRQGVFCRVCEAWLSASCNRLLAFSNEVASVIAGKETGSPQTTARCPYGSGLRAASHLCLSKTAGRQSAPTGTNGAWVNDASATAPTFAIKAGPPPSAVIKTDAPRRSFSRQDRERIPSVVFRISSYYVESQPVTQERKIVTTWIGCDQNLNRRGGLSRYEGTHE